MNTYARNSDLPELRLVDDADASLGTVEPEQDLASLPTLPRFSAKDLRPSTSAAANAPEMASPPIASPLELSLEPIDERRPAPPPMSYVAPPPGRRGAVRRHVDEPEGPPRGRIKPGARQREG